MPSQRYHHQKETRASSSIGEPWVDKSFVKDTGKLRPRERYWHFLGDGVDPIARSTSATLGVVSDQQEKKSPIVLPDAICLRKYLRLFKFLLEPTPTQTPNWRWCLLESTTEYVDYRNSVQQEKAAQQERFTIQKLVREGKLLPFCDLSVRVQDDEWGWLEYEKLSLETRSQHALLRAARLLQNTSVERKQSDGKPSVVILVDDSSTGWDGFHLEKGIEVMSLERFLSSFLAQKEESKREQVNHLMNICREEYKQRHSRTLEAQIEKVGVYEYWPPDRVSLGLKNGSLIRGRLEVSKDNTREAFVRSNGKHWFIDLRNGHHNRAMHQDIVILQPLPETEWGRPVGRRRLVFHKDTGEDDDLWEDDASFPKFPSAQVVAIHSMARRLFVATLVDTPMPEESTILLVPMDIRVPKIRLPTRTWQKLVGMRLLIQIDGWEAASNYPHGHVLDIVGPIGDLETEIKCLLCENEIRLDPFSVAARACLPSEGAQWRIPDSELENRRDLRSYRIFSVDPIGCQDIDDTMHARYLPNGDLEIGVHIADVTWFVPLNSALDREARLRGTTFYLVDRRFDMLPQILSSNLCSLHGNTDRLAVSVIWTLSPDMETIKDTFFGRTIIHNVAAMTYEQAANILAGKKPEKTGEKSPPPLTAGSAVDPALIPALKKDLEVLTKIARKRRKYREDVGGAVDLSGGEQTGELKFTLVNGKPVSVTPKQGLEIHHTIAELMIWANTSVAEKIQSIFPNSSLLRIHREVEEERFDDLREMLSAGKVELEGKTNMELAQTLKKAGSNTDPVVACLFRSLATRAMSEAQYISTGDTNDGKKLSHYGLGLSLYTHFTSPIRRYADVVVHHQLLASLAYKNTSTNDRDIPAMQEDPINILPKSTVVSMLDDKDDRESLHREKVSPSTPVDLAIDDLIAGSNDLVSPDLVPNDNIVTDTGDDLSIDFDIDALIEGAADLVVGDLPAESSDVGDTEDIEIDDLIDGAGDIFASTNVIEQDSNVVDLQTETKNLLPANETESVVDNLSPFSGDQVSLVCERLNLHNRLAKKSSLECEHLFLSLLFKDQVEVTEAVVLHLKDNGFVAYVPRFDLRAPVYLRDSDGFVQMDPALLGLPNDSGDEATLGFAWSKDCRKFRPKEAELRLEEGVALNVLAQGHSRLTLRPLDIVAVEIFCNDWDQRARIPAPRLHLVPSSPKKVQSRAAVSTGDYDSPEQKKECQVQPTSNPRSMFDILEDATTHPGSLPLEERRMQLKQGTRQEPMRGRIVFGEFVNPNTRVAAQQVAQQAAAADAENRRRNYVQKESKKDDYSTNRRIEREVTIRQQRLDKQKRETRRAKKN